MERRSVPPTQLRALWVELTADGSLLGATLKKLAGLNVESTRHTKNGLQLRPSQSALQPIYLRTVHIRLKR